MQSVRSMVASFRGALPRVAARNEQCHLHAAVRGVVICSAQAPRSFVSAIRTTPSMSASTGFITGGLPCMMLPATLRRAAAVLQPDVIPGGFGSMQVRGMMHGRKASRLGRPVKHRCVPESARLAHQVHGPERRFANGVAPRCQGRDAENHGD